MRIFKNNSIFLILILILSISISGCSSKAPKVEEPIVLVEEKNQEPEIQIEEKEKEEGLIEDLTEDEEELSIEEDKTVEEEIDVAEKDKEEPVAEPEQAIIVKEPEKTTTDETVEVPEKEEIGEEVKNAIKIKGNVGKESSFTLAELKNMTDIIFEDDFYSLNNFGTTNHTLFKGVNLWKLLHKADISSSATKVKIIATDGYEVEFTIAQVKRQDYIDESNLDKAFPMIIAWEEKGKEFDSSDAPPYKLIVGQSEPGDVNKPQWVSKIDRIIVE